MREFLEKYGLRLLIITTVCAVLISVLSFVSATSGFLQNAVGVLTYPFRSAVTAVATWAEDKQRYYKDYSDLIAENEALRERVAELERDARQAEADREENALLRELLELREDHGGNTVIRRHEADLLLLDVPAEELRDVDTAQALEELKAEEQV